MGVPRADLALSYPDDDDNGGEDDGVDHPEPRRSGEAGCDHHDGGSRTPGVSQGQSCDEKRRRYEIGGDCPFRVTIANGDHTNTTLLVANTTTVASHHRSINCVLILGYLLSRFVHPGSSRGDRLSWSRNGTVTNTRCACQPTAGAPLLPAFQVAHNCRYGRWRADNQPWISPPASYAISWNLPSVTSRLT